MWVLVDTLIEAMDEAQRAPVLDHEISHEKR